VATPRPGRPPGAPRPGARPPGQGPRAGAPPPAPTAKRGPSILPALVFVAILGGIGAFFAVTPQGKGIAGAVIGTDQGAGDPAVARIREYLTGEVRSQVAYLVSTPTPTPVPTPTPTSAPTATVTPRPTATVRGVAARPTSQSLTPISSDPTGASTLIVLYYEALNARDLVGAVTFWAPSQEQVGREVADGSIQRGERFTVKDAAAKPLPGVDAVEVTVHLDVTDSRGTPYRDIEHVYLMRYADSTWGIISRRQ
jgi:hypothetical protein